jgi:serine/threonine-protein kinase
VVERVPFGRYRRKPILMAAPLLAAAVIATSTAGCATQHREPSETVSPSRGAPITLAFTGLNNPSGVAVDGAGNVYVADYTNSRVVKLAGGASAPTVLPFTGLDHIYGVAVDGAGNVYVAESNNYTRDSSRVAELAGGTGPQTELPLTGLKVPYGVAVDGAGSVYVADYGNQQVVKLPAS